MKRLIATTTALSVALTSVPAVPLWAQSEGGEEQAVCDPTTGANCDPSQMPQAAPEPEPQPEAAPEPEPQPEAAPEPEPQPEAAPEPEPQPEAAPEPEPQPEAAPEEPPVEEAAPQDQPVEEAAPEDQPTEEAAPEDQPNEEAAPEDQPTDQAAPEDQPTEEAAPEDQPTDQAAPEDQPTDQAAPEDQPTDQAAPEDQPTDQAATEDQPTDQAAPEDQPTDQAAPEDQPTDQAATEDQPTDQAAPEDQPTDQAATEDQPTDQAAPEDQPTDQAAPEDQPTDQAAPEDQPTDQAAPEDQPTDQAAPEDQPTDQAAPEDQPTDQAAPEDQPTDEAAPADQPTDETTTGDDPAAAAADAPADAPATDAPAADAPADEVVAPEQAQAAVEELAVAPPPAVEEPAVEPPAPAPEAAQSLTELVASDPGPDQPDATAPLPVEQPMAASRLAAEPPPPPTTDLTTLRQSSEVQTVQVQTITETTTRTSRQEFSAAPVMRDGRRHGGLTDLEKVGLVALGALAVGAILNNRNDQVMANTGDRVIIRRGNGYGADDYYIYKDDDALLRRPGSQVRTETFRDGSTRTIVRRDDGTQVVTIRDASGRVLRRSTYDHRGREIVLFDDFIPEERVVLRDLPRPRGRVIDLDRPLDDALMRAEVASEDVADLGRTFSLRQIRDIPQVRALAATVKVPNLTFATGSAALAPAQAKSLAKLGRLMAKMLRDNPREMFLVEGHTDAVGSRVSNLALSDRRAESVALALTEYYGIPPENMVVQGYGESEPVVKTARPEPKNRRVVVRIITPLLAEK